VPPYYYGAGIWLGTPLDFHLAFRTETPAPGTEPGVYWTRFYSLQLNEQGHVAWFARLEGGGITTATDCGVYVGKEGEMQLVAREGMRLDGSSILLGELDVNTSYLCMNERDELAFAAPVTGPGVDPSNDHAIFGALPTGKVLMLAREGDSIDTGGGQLRTIELLDEWATRVWINDRSQVLFEARFTDGTFGIVLAQLPEPAFFSLITLAAPALLRARTPSR
jgi:hypothetical protein